MSSTTISMFLLVVMVMAFPLVVQFYVRFKTKGKMLGAILGKDKPVEFKLLKVIDGEFVKDGPDQWIVETKLIRLVRYPMMWPPIMSMFQQLVPCSLVLRGRSTPLDWEDPTVGSLSSKELPVVLDPHWLISLVKGVGEEGRQDKTSRMLTFIAVGASVLGLIVCLYLVMKMGNLQDAVNTLRVVKTGG